MKRFSAGLLIGLLISLILATTSLALAGQSIKLIVNGKEIQCDVPPQMINGRVMVPARFVAEPLGAKVEWDNEKNAVVIYTLGGGGGGTYSTIKNGIVEWNKEVDAIWNRITTLNAKFPDITKSKSYLEQCKSLNQLALDLNPILQDTLAIIPPPEKKEAHDFLIEYIKAMQGYYNAYSYWALYTHYKDIKASTRLNEANYYVERANSMQKAFFKYR